MRYELRNRLPQALPITLRDKGDPKKFVYSQIGNRGRKIIDECEMSPQIESLKQRGTIKVIALTEAGRPVSTPKLAAPAPAKLEIAVVSDKMSGSPEKSSSSSYSSKVSARKKKK